MQKLHTSRAHRVLPKVDPYSGERPAHRSLKTKSPLEVQRKEVVVHADTEYVIVLGAHGHRFGSVVSGWFLTSLQGVQFPLDLFLHVLGVTPLAQCLLFVCLALIAFSLLNTSPALQCFSH